MNSRVLLSASIERAGEPALLINYYAELPRGVEARRRFYNREINKWMDPFPNWTSIDVKPADEVES